MINVLCFFSLKPTYLKNHLVAKDPFISLDTQGVGALMQVAVSKIRSTGATVQVD